jgi:transketolase
MKALRDVFGDTLVSLGSTNPNVVVLDADLANSTKADKFAKMYPARFLQMGIAEQNFVGVAVGLASLGFVPWLSSFTVFFTHRAIDPIRMLVAQTHANVKIGAAYAGLMTGLRGRHTMMFRTLRSCAQCPTWQWLLQRTRSKVKPSFGGPLNTRDRSTCA